jgi:hypothetical protein
MSFLVDIQHDNGGQIEKIMKALDELRNHEVMIGIPDSDGGRKAGDPVSNAELLFIHTNGSPVNNIPPRPVLEPAMKKKQDQISTLLRKATEEALDGDKAGVMNALEIAGIEGQNIARKYFTDSNGWEANTPATVARKGSSRPLIDTGQMRKAITYVVREV